jgi:CRP-like cAMP-binding protein
VFPHAARECCGLVSSLLAAGRRDYVVRSASVLIHDGARELETLGEGGIFGELALVDGRPRSASATAVGETTVVPIDERRFQHLVQQTPYFAQAVMRVMA